MARTRASAAERSLHQAMAAPSTTGPDVVVLDCVDDYSDLKVAPDPKRDLWLSTVDGRHQSAIIPVRVGPHAEVFPVHRDILTRSEYFSKALNGEFREASDQAIDLPEEDPDIFSFVVAFLYEGNFLPIKPIATVLVAQPDKGKRKERIENSNSDSEGGTDTAESTSDDGARNRRRQNQRRSQDRLLDQQQRKEPGRHRPDCHCASCTAEAIGPPCWSCGLPRRPPLPRNQWYGVRGGPPPPPPPYPVVVGGRPPRPIPRERNRDRRRGTRNNTVIAEGRFVEERMSVEDTRTWALAYALSVDVYICAERYLMTDFKNCISAYIINNFEIAGLDAALPAVLQSCMKLSLGLSLKDPLLKKVFARVGFLQARLWKNYPDETSNFFAENPGLAVLLMKEMMERKEEESKDGLPAMEGSIPPPPAPRDPRDPIIVHAGRHRYEIADD